MLFIQRSDRVLEEAEKKVRTLMKGALEVDDYEAVATLAETANGLHLLAQSGKHSTAGPQSRRRPESASSPQGRTKYPIFHREGETLVKIAWSKTRQAEYEHKSPSATLFRLVDEIKVLQRKSDPFKAADLLPLGDRQGDDIPPYQVYACLGWLRSQGLVSKQGHSYLATKGFALRRVQDAWDALLK